MNVNKVFGELSNSEWLNVLKESVSTNIINGVQFPGFPPAHLQTQFVGNSYIGALNEAGKFYADTKDFYQQKNNQVIDQITRVLDFGIGWGRITRFFWRDVGENNLYGVDVDPEILDICRKTNVPGTFSQIQPWGNLPFSDSFFDLVFAYSVFTHLSEKAHLHWIYEIKRVLKPGGIFVATLEPRRFIDFIGNIPESASSNWHVSLRSHAKDITHLHNKFDLGEFIYLPTGGGKYREASFYGDAIVPLEYLQRMWKGYKLEKYLDDPAQYWQAVLFTSVI